jgi:hypothetical protein
MKPRFECQQQPVEMVELIEALERRALEHDAGESHGDRCDEERPPVSEPQPLQDEVRRERAHHVLGTVREVDDVEQPEDDRESEAQHRVERAVDQPDQQLPEQRLRRNPEDRHATSGLRQKTMPDLRPKNRPEAQRAAKMVPTKPSSRVGAGGGSGAGEGCADPFPPSE